MAKCRSCDAASNQLSMHGLCKKCQKTRGALQFARNRAKYAKQLEKAATKAKNA